MKKRVKITTQGGSWYDEPLKTTVYFKVNPCDIIGMPDGGQSYTVKTWDKSGELDTVFGDTHHKHNGLTFVKRSKPLSLPELIKEILNLP